MADELRVLIIAGPNGAGKKPIEESRDRDLRLSKAALLRAAMRARELAEHTGTSGLDKTATDHSEKSSESEEHAAVHEKSADYGDKPG